jgi:hypothetical protein
VKPTLTFAWLFAWCGVLAAWQAAPPSGGPPPPPSEIARTLAGQGTTVEIPVTGQIRREIEKGAPTFQTPNGETTAMLLRFPAYQQPYLMTVSSFKRGLGPATKVFVPMGITFDADFRPISRFGDEQLRSVEDRLVIDLMIGDKLAQARYLLLFTRASQVDHRVQTGRAQGNILERKLEGLLGVGEAQRSLEATIYVATGPVPETPLGKKLGPPWTRIEGANEAKVRELVGAPSTMQQYRNAMIWTYDKTPAGKVRVYIIDGVASLNAPVAPRQ